MNGIFHILYLIRNHVNKIAQISSWNTGCARIIIESL